MLWLRLLRYELHRAWSWRGLGFGLLLLAGLLVVQFVVTLFCLDWRYVRGPTGGNRFLVQSYLSALGFSSPWVRVLLPRYVPAGLWLVSLTQAGLSIAGAAFHFLAPGLLAAGIATARKHGRLRACLGHGFSPAEALRALGTALLLPFYCVGLIAWIGAVIAYWSVLPDLAGAPSLTRWGNIPVLAQFALLLAPLHWWSRTELLTSLCALCPRVWQAAGWAYAVELGLLPVVYWAGSLANRFGYTDALTAPAAWWVLPDLAVLALVFGANLFVRTAALDSLSRDRPTAAEDLDLLPGLQ